MSIKRHMMSDVTAHMAGMHLHLYQLQSSKKPPLPLIKLLYFSLEST